MLEPVLGRGGSRGPQLTVDRRLMVNAILYQVVAAHGQACDTAWRPVAPPLERAKPRLRRRKAAPVEHEHLLAA
jgi:hypothetical protein